jgi:hypothetical protein
MDKKNFTFWELWITFWELCMIEARLSTYISFVKILDGSLANRIPEKQWQKCAAIARPTCRLEFRRFGVGPLHWGPHDQSQSREFETGVSCPIRTLFFPDILKELRA